MAEREGVRIPVAGWSRLWQAALHRSRAEWPVVLAAWLLLLAALTLLAAGTLYAQTVALGGLRASILAAPPASRAATVASTVAARDVAALDAGVAPVLSGSLGATGGEVALVAQSENFTPTSLPAAGGALALVGSYRDIERHAALLDGHWATPGHDPVEATLSEGAAAALALRPGDRVSLQGRVDAGLALEVLVTGIWRPDPSDPYWVGDALDLQGSVTVGAFTTDGPFVVADQDLLTRATVRNARLEWRILPAIDRLEVDQVNSLRGGLANLYQSLRGVLRPGQSVTVTSELPKILSESGRAVLVSRSGVLLLTLEFALLAGYAVLLVGAILAEKRRPEAALLRSRGATTLHLTLLALGEAIVLAASAAALAPWLAAGIVRLMGTAGPLRDTGITATASVSTDVLLVTAAAALVCVLALVLPQAAATVGIGDGRTGVGRPARRTIAQRLGIDLALLVVAGIGLWQLRFYGAPLTANIQGTLGLDPLLVAAPALALVAGAVATSRILPRLAEIAERLLDRRRDLVVPLGARQVARRPLRYTRSALLLMLACGLGTFAVVYGGTWTRSQGDQAAFQAVADERVVTSQYPHLPSWAVGPAYRAIPGVENAMAVFHQPLEVGRAVRKGDLLGVVPEVAAGILSPPRGGFSSDLPSLLAKLGAARPASPSVPLPGGLHRLQIHLGIHLRDTTDPLATLNVPVEQAYVQVIAVVDNADGLHRVIGDHVAINGPGQAEVRLDSSVLGSDLVPGGALALRALELTIVAPAFGEISGTPSGSASNLEGTVALAGVSGSTSAQGDDWTPLETSGADGWSWSALDRGLPLAGAIGRTLAFGSDRPLNGTSTFRLWSHTPASNEVPAIVSTAFLQQAGAQSGDTLAATIQGEPVTLRVLGEFDAFPPIDPATPLAVVDGSTLAEVRFAGFGRAAAAQEWWLSVDPSAADGVIATLDRDPYSAAQVIGRQALTRSLTTAPVPLGLIGALALGSLAALAIAAIGFVLSATASANERLGEFALLRALGLSERLLVLWLALENVFLLLFALIAGSGLGLLLAWLVLPFATLTRTGAQPVPAPTVVVPWEVLLPVYVLVALVLVLTAVASTRSVPGVRISGVLRARDG